MKCPVCQSENTQRLQVVYENGTTNIETNSKTVGGGIGGSALGGAAAYTNTTGVSQTRLAKKASPPFKKQTSTAVMIALGSVFLAYLFLSDGAIWWGLAAIAISAASTWAAKSFYEHNSQIFPGLYKEWQHSWVCHKCGNMYKDMTLS